MTIRMVFFLERQHMLSRVGRTFWDIEQSAVNLKLHMNGE
jgi:hypothetical protein